MEGYDFPTPAFSHSPVMSLACFCALSRITHLPVFVKTYTSVSLPNTNRLLNDAVALASIEHPNNVKIEEVKLTEVGGNCTVHVVYEYVGKTLEGDLQERTQGKRDYTEAEIMTFLCQVGSGLTQGKNKTICHRRLKPANILITATGGFKVTDYRPHSIAAETVYSSPQLRDFYCHHRSQYDLFASDVYSLGLITLHMTLLKPPHQLQTFHDLQTKTDTEIASLKYSIFMKEVISGMLKVEEKQRISIEKVVEKATMALECESEEEEVSEETR